jgi:hypothetical protein
MEESTIEKPAEKPGADGWLVRYSKTMSEVTKNLTKGLGLFLKREKKE